MATRYLITGGAGFIGSHFVRGTLGTGRPGAERDVHVTVLDKLTYAGNLRNLDPVAGDPRLRFVHGDVCDPADVAAAMSGVDVVVHFAAESHVDRSITAADEFLRTNVTGTHTLLEAARDQGVLRFVHVSTDEVYGSIEQGAWTEDRPLDPSSPYSASKAGADLLARAYHRTHGLPVCVTRGSNTYGPYQFPEKLVPLFVTNLLDGRTVPLYGAGDNVRDWLHVDDHCAGIRLVAERGVPGEIYNIGGGTELTNVELTRRILDEVGADWSRVEPVADRLGHDRRYALDWSKAGTELGYEPAVSLDAGLADTVRWYADHRSWWEPLRTAPRR